MDESMEWGCFVTGTDTDVGKTIVTAALLKAILDTGNRGLAVKPVQTGVPGESGVHPVQTCAPQYDAARYLAAVGSKPDNDIALTLECFEPACSPHLAAEMAGRVLRVDDLVARVKALTHAPCGTHRRFVLAEGAGGVYVPISRTESTLDFMDSLAWPVVLVAANRLGCVNHVLLSLAALRSRGLRVAAVVFTSPTPSESALSWLAEDNVRIVREQGKVECVLELPFIAALSGPHAVQEKEAWAALASLLLPLAKHLAPAPRDYGCGGDSACYSHSSITTPASLLDFDRRHLWHPYTSALDPLPVYEAVSASGASIRLRDGQQVVDGMASWWCAIHGYSHPALVKAVCDQASTMSHVMFGGLTHAPAVLLAERLLSLLPSGLEHIFWADSGSVSVEVALKMAVQYWQAKGQRGKTRFLAPRGGYHGDTLGAMSVCDPETGMHSLFAGLVAQQIFVPRPACRFDAPFDPACMAEVEDAMKRHAHELAAVIIEPVVQGAGGMWFYHPDYLRRLRELCDQHQVLLIVDEIATGFGRTGRMFASEWADLHPDILCLGKGLTGGTMTLAATTASHEVAQGISAHGGVFMHGPTFMGNPLACAAAKASLELLLSSPWQEQVATIETTMRQGLEPCRTLRGVTDVRVLGSIGVVEVENELSSTDIARLQSFFVKHGVWVRPFGRVIYIMPPYIISHSELLQLLHAITEALQAELHVCQ